MKYLFTLSLLSSVLFSSFAQNANKQFGLKAGWTEAFIYDEHASPLLYQSDMLHLSGLYQRTGKLHFEIALQLKIGTHQARSLPQRKGAFPDNPDIYGNQEDFELKANPFFSMFQGALHIKALYPVSSHHQVGLSVNARYIYTGMGLDTWQYSQLDLAPEYRFVYPIWSGDIQASFSLPLLAVVQRHNYAFDPSLPDLTNYYRGYLRTSTSITSINELVNPRIQAGYTWHFKDGRSLGVHYFASWTSFPSPRPLRMFENGVEAIYLF
jgi:hypothetical protein